MQSSRIGALEAALAQVKQLLLQQQGQGAGQRGVLATTCNHASTGSDCRAFKQCWLSSCAAMPVLHVQQSHHCRPHLPAWHFSARYLATNAWHIFQAACRPADSWLPPAGKNYDALLKQLRTELGGLKKKVAALASLQIHSDGDHAMLSGKALQGYR